MLQNTAEIAAPSPLSLARILRLPLAANLDGARAFRPADALKHEDSARSAISRRGHLHVVEPIVGNPASTVAAAHFADRSIHVDVGAVNTPVRRVFDVVIAVLGGILVLPVVCLIALTIKLQDGGPILFSQQRVGRGGRMFRCLKFRSMVVDAEAKLQAVLDSDAKVHLEWLQHRKLKADPRTTGFGRFIRRTSLDELPQLYNVLKGDMTMVGPRPIVPSEVNIYGRWFPRYASVRPGLTGLWQVRGRNDVTYRKRIAMDLLLTRGNSLSAYAFILLLTVPAVLARRGSY